MAVILFTVSDLPHTISLLSSVCFVFFDCFLIFFFGDVGSPFSATRFRRRFFSLILAPLDVDLRTPLIWRFLNPASLETIFIRCFPVNFCRDCVLSKVLNQADNGILGSLYSITLFLAQCFMCKSLQVSKCPIPGLVQVFDAQSASL